jgi:hypothetical protein
VVIPTLLMHAVVPVQVTDWPTAWKLLPRPSQAHTSRLHGVVVFQHPVVVYASVLNAARPATGVHTHGLPHDPQADSSVARFLQNPVQQVVPGPQTVPHTPQLLGSTWRFLQTPLQQALPPHETPQPLQFDGSAWRFLQTPEQQV